ncbi:hypothetical protein JW752_00295 [Candidatus Peregrinibacteria bacterium]|nr:hypothetical protein [Candidatus Peregrinibacteria bacterium]
MQNFKKKDIALAGGFSRLSFGRSKDSHSVSQKKDGSKKAVQRKGGLVL